MKPDEIRKKSKEEIEIELRELREKLYDVDYQHKNRQLEDVNLRKRLKRDIARYLTILKEKEVAETNENRETVS
jgi:large subunit ribosomal protein L29